MPGESVKELEEQIGGRNISESTDHDGLGPLDDQRAKASDPFRRYRDVLEIAHLVSWCTERDYLIKNCLEHINRRLKKRARCALLEGGELRICCWVGRYDFPTERVPICQESIVWKAVQERQPLNLTNPQECEGYRHTLPERVKIKSIIPLWHVDSFSQEERIVGALIVDSGTEGTAISAEDFEYLKDVGGLIGSAIGKADLLEKLGDCYRGKQAMVMDTVDGFRNRIAAIGTISRRMERMAATTGLAQEIRALIHEVELLEFHLEQFEKYLKN
jgi:GAF domain-containing protein